MKSFLKRKGKKAFTLIELVIVVVVIGILAAMTIPRMERDLRQEAVANIASAIRYAKHMALVDDVMGLGNADSWQRSFWRFGIEGCSDNGLFFYIAADKDRQGDIDADEVAVDPSNGLPMMGDNGAPCAHGPNNHASPNIFLTKLYGISDPDGVTFDCGDNSNARYIGFDRLGRPHRGFAGNGGSSTPDYSTVMQQNCTITLRFDDSNVGEVNITVERTTGRVFYDLNR
jgi:prepilin-type N-terminal cleavage/methylation domain-containing protein